MSKRGYRVPNEIKQEILGKIKNEGLSVAQASENYGVSTGSIYKWLGTKAQGVVSQKAHNKLKKENAELKRLIGELTIKMSLEAKKGARRS